MSDTISKVFARVSHGGDGSQEGRGLRRKLNLKERVAGEVFREPVPDRSLRKRLEFRRDAPALRGELPRLLRVLRVLLRRAVPL